jgi:hypothetical protein
MYPSHKLLAIFSYMVVRKGTARTMMVAQTLLKRKLIKRGEYQPLQREKGKQNLT